MTLPADCGDGTQFIAFNGREGEPLCYVLTDPASVAVDLVCKTHVS